MQMYGGVMMKEARQEEQEFKTLAHQLPALAKGSSRLFLCRHGETDYNLKRIFQGRGVNMPLNRKGIEQALCLAESMKHVPLRAIYSSSLHRAKETAGIVASYHPHVQTAHFQDLEEMSFGELEGQSHDKYTETLRSINEKWRQGDFHAKFPSGECPMDVVKRGAQTIHDIMCDSMDDHLLMVTHGRFNKIILSYLVHASLETMHTITQDNTCVNVLDYEVATGKYTPLTINDTSHLSF